MEYRTFWKLISIRKHILYANINIVLFTSYLLDNTIFTHIFVKISRGKKKECSYYIVYSPMLRDYFFSKK